MDASLGAGGGAAAPVAHYVFPMLMRGAISSVAPNIEDEPDVLELRDEAQKCLFAMKYLRTVSRNVNYRDEMSTKMVAIALVILAGRFVNEDGEPSVQAAAIALFEKRLSNPARVGPWLESLKVLRARLQTASVDEVAKVEDAYSDETALVATAGTLARRSQAGGYARRRVPAEEKKNTTNAVISVLLKKRDGRLILSDKPGGTRSMHGGGLGGG